jgi:hypothetical protein
MGKSSNTQPAGNTTTTQTSQPWSTQQPYLSQAMGQAQNLFQNNTPQYFPQSTVAPFNPTQQTGFNLETNLGMNGNPAVNSATNALTGIENGSMLSAGNPYFQSTAGNVMGQVLPQIESQFEGGGRMGSPGAAYAAAQGATNAIAPYAFSNYQQGLQNMVQGAMVAPGLQQANIQDVGLVQDAGNQQQQQSQAQLNDAINRFNFQQQLPYNKLGMFEQGVQGNYGGTSTLSQPYFMNNSGKNGLMGGAAGGAVGSLLGPSGAGVLGSGTSSALPKLGMLGGMMA